MSSCTPRARPLKPVDRIVLSCDTMTAPTGHFGSLDFIETAWAMCMKYSSQLSTCTGILIREESSCGAGGGMGRVFCASDIAHSSVTITPTAQYHSRNVPNE